MKWFDVHFSLNGFYKIEAENEEKAMERAEKIFNENQADIEDAVKTGIGIEIVEALEEE